MATLNSQLEVFKKTVFKMETLKKVQRLLGQGDFINPDGESH